ncbi:hypothetical protein HDU98_000263 [Podochytrium sp. JEL0797]|nr:hypothetical protein HDU98_000263 [Podochytrium sp. JEL0797]
MKTFGPAALVAVAATLVAAQSGTVSPVPVRVTTSAAASSLSSLSVMATTSSAPPPLATTAPPPPPPPPTQPATQTSPVVCIPLTGSAECPSFAARWINANSETLLALSASRNSQATVLDFDNMVSKWSHAGPMSVLAQAQCQTWDFSLIRYSQQFHCEYFTQNPYIYGDGASQDCNALNSPSPATLPRIANATCQDFLKTVYDYISLPDTCAGTTKAGRTSVFQNMTMVCNSAFAATNGLGATAVSVDMGVDTTSEHFNCGFGVYQGNTTQQLESAFNFCLSTPEICCQQDPTLLTALNSGTLPQPPPPPPTWACQVKFNRFFTASCGQIIGATSGTLLGFLALAIVWWGVSRQDVEAMKRTASGKAKQEHEWLSNWWNNSVFANPAAAHPAPEVSPDFNSYTAGSTAYLKQQPTAASLLPNYPHYVRNAPTHHQPGVFSNDRRSFQKFDQEPMSESSLDSSTEFTEYQHQNHQRRSQPSPPVAPAATPRRPSIPLRDVNLGGASHGGGGLSPPPQSHSRSASRSPVRGVDPFAEMMGGGAPVDRAASPGVPAYKALYEFVGAKAGFDLDLARVGDRLVVLEVKAGGVALARNLDTGRQGVVPMNLLGR